MGDRARSRLVPPSESLERGLRRRVGEVKRLELNASEPRPAAPDGGDEPDRTSIGTAILGGGPAGLTAAYILGQGRRPGAVFEADGSVGGIAKTIEFNGYRFDLG